MFEQVFERLQKATESSIAFQQEMFRKWVSLWPGIPGYAFPFAEMQKVQKKWAEVVGGLLKKQNESLEAQFKASLQTIEEAFRLAEIKDPEQLRVKTVELWQKTFDYLRQLTETQMHDFQSAVGKWAELMTKGVA